MFVNDQIWSTTAQKALLQSETFKSNYSECKMKFFYYLDGVEPGNLVLYATYGVGEDSPYSKLWSSRNTPSTDSWQEVVVGIGGGREKLFSLSYLLIDIPLGFDGTAAIDDVTFFDCVLPEPPIVTSSCPEHQCENGLCIAQSKLCDLTHDCGDGSDEDVKTCNKYHRYDFESATDFQQGVDTIDDDFDWSLQRGPTKSILTGPSRDHTIGTDDGYYLYIEASQRQYKERAWLLMHPFSASSRDCRLRFFYHIYGTHAEMLSVKVRTHRNSAPTEVWSRSNPDEDTWLPSGEIEFPVSTRDFQVIFEGQVGVSWLGDVAIDDVSFTPGCQFSERSVLPLDPSATTVAPLVTTKRPRNCPQSQFECVTNRKCIEMRQVCDFREDCQDGSDEEQCRKCIYSINKEANWHGLQP
jgi:hypothetical protein